MMKHLRKPLRLAFDPDHLVAFIVILLPLGLAQESKRSSFRAKQGIFISSEHVLEIWNLTLSNPNPGFADATTGGPLTTSSYHHFE